MSILDSFAGEQLMLTAGPGFAPGAVPPQMNNFNGAHAAPGGYGYPPM